MRAPLRVIARAPLGAGFRLAGLAVEEAADVADGAARIEALATRAGATVVLAEDALLAALSPAARDALARRADRIVVPVPGPSWARVGGAEDYIVEILRRAIGYRVRLR